MTRVDLHPEDLLDQLRAGDLRDDERDRLLNHCDHCSACAFELQLIDNHPVHAEPTELDHAIAARAMDRMLSIDAPAVRSPAKSQNVFRAAALIVAGVVVGGSVSAAALTGANPFLLIDVITAWVTPAPRPPQSPVTVTAPRIRRQREVEPAQADALTPVQVEAPVAVPVVDEPPLALPVAEPAAPRTPSPIEPPPRVSVPIGAPTPTPGDPATWFFRAASHARAEGRYREALALYGVLRREFSGSEAEVVARVALGRLWLTHLDDPAQALNAFDSYLRARPDGALAEEARSGRVGALRKLGRDADADSAMQDLLAHHPNSLYAAPTAVPTP